MKIMRKDTITKKNHVDYMKAERDILTKVVHPFIVQLRYSFQVQYSIFENLASIYVLFYLHLLINFSPFTSLWIFMLFFLLFMILVSWYEKWCSFLLLFWLQLNEWFGCEIFISLFHFDNLSLGALTMSCACGLHYVNAHCSLFM